VTDPHFGCEWNKAIRRRWLSRDIAARPETAECGERKAGREDAVQGYVSRSPDVDADPVLHRRLTEELRTAMNEFVDPRIRKPRRASIVRTGCTNGVSSTQFKPLVRDWARIRNLLT